MREELRPLELSMQHQVFSFRAGEVGNQFHPFSITSAPGDRTLMLTVKAVGDYTRALRRLEAGADAVFEGPYGSFSHQNVPRARQLWIAGGIGVTPFLSVARGLADDDRLDVDFDYCVERPAEAHFLDELEAIAARRPGFRVMVVPREQDGFLSVERLASEQEDLEHADVIICGPPAMIESPREQLIAAGVPPGQIHAEEFGFAKLGRVAETTPGARITRASGETAITATVAGSPAAGKAVFASAGCGACHTLAAAGANGKVGPNLDDAKPDAAQFVDVVAHGKGGMPPYKGRLTDEQVRDVAAYVAQAAGA